MQDRHVLAQDAGGNQPQHGLAAADDERVAGVVPALEAHDALRALGQPVDDLALAFVAPLGADDDDVLAHDARIRALARSKWFERVRARRSCADSRHDVGELAQVERETGRRTCAAERLADAIVAAAVADAVGSPAVNTEKIAPFW